MRLAAFIIALLLLAGSVEPTRGWLIALTVIGGLAAVRPRFGRGIVVRPAIDLRLGVFLIAATLLAGAIEPTRNTLIALAVVSGLAMTMPHLLRVPLSDDRWDGSRHPWGRPRVWRTMRARSLYWDGDDWP